MKKLFASLLALAMLLFMAACGGKKEAPDPTNDTASGAQNEPAVELPSFTFTQYGNAKITIVGAEFIKNDWDEDVLRIYYDYTNTSNSACNQYPSVALDFMSITQDGEERDRVWFGTTDDCAIPEDLHSDCPTQPGCTSRQTMLIECDPNGGIVEVSCYIMIGNWVYEEESVECFTFQIDPKDLMGAPAPLVMPAITNPTYALGLPTSGTNDYPIASEMSIDGWELTKGDEGEDVLRVKLTVTNNSDEAWPPSIITNGVEAYQDGLGLQWFSNWDLEESTDEDDAYGEDLNPGETVRCNALFLIRNDSPVEVVIEDLDSELRLGMICDVKAEMEAIQAALEAQQQASNAANAEAIKALIGYWDRTDSWPDHLTFNADGTGIHDMTGDEYAFTFTLENNVLHLYYDDGDEAEYTISWDGGTLLLNDGFDRIQTFEKGDESAAQTGTSESDKTTAATADPDIDLADELIGVWVSDADGETYVFNKDGTGYQIYEGVTYGYTYEIDDDYVEIFYDDGSSDSFYIAIDGDTLTIAYNWTYTRQK